MDNLWRYRDDTWARRDLVGYDIEATDGLIGNIDDATTETDACHLVVDTGFWIFGQQRLIPAGAVTGVDHDRKKVQVNMTKEQVKIAPHYEVATWDDDARNRHTDYYSPYCG